MKTEMKTEIRVGKNTYRVTSYFDNNCGVTFEERMLQYLKQRLLPPQEKTFNRSKSDSRC